MRLSVIATPLRNRRIPIRSPKDHEGKVPVVRVNVNQGRQDAVRVSPGLVAGARKKSISGAEVGQVQVENVTPRCISGRLDNRR